MIQLQVLQLWTRVLVGHYQVIMAHYSYGPVYIMGPIVNKGFSRPRHLQGKG